MSYFYSEAGNGTPRIIPSGPNSPCHFPRSRRLSRFSTETNKHFVGLDILSGVICTVEKTWENEWPPQKSDRGMKVGRPVSGDLLAHFVDVPGWSARPHRSPR